MALILSWAFTEGSGNPVESVNSTTSTLHGSTWETDTYPCLTFGGTNADYVDTNVNGLIDAPFTMCFRLKRISTLAGNPILFGRNHSGAQYKAFELRTWGADYSLYFHFYDGSGTEHQCQSGASYWETGWYDYAFTFDGRYGKFYRAASGSGTSQFGSTVDLTASYSVATDTYDYFFPGRNNDTSPTDQLDCKFALIKFFDTVLDAAGIDTAFGVSGGSSVSPSASPSSSPSISPSSSISISPSSSPSVSPSASVSISPSISPSPSVSVSPSLSPSASVSISPSPSPSASPSASPSIPGSASQSPSLSPSGSPSKSPSPSVSVSPSSSPSVSPSASPSTALTAAYPIFGGFIVR